MEMIGRTVLLGIGATAFTDLWGLARGPLLGVPAPDYRLVGRWIGHMRDGCFRHASIARAAPVAHESVIGWVVHYLTGIAFGFLLIALAGNRWLARPLLLPALLVGVGTVAAPFLIMQPAMGAGVASSRSTRPGSARLQSLLTHCAFGIGLYATGLVTQWLHP